MTDDQTLTIRTASLADLAAIDRLLAASYPASLKRDYAPSVLVTALPLISRAQPRLVSSGTYYVALGPDGAVIAAGGWTWIGPQGLTGGADLAHIRHVVTDHRMQRRGIARALMTHALARAVDAGVKRMDCQSTLGAVPFYAAMGFRKVGQIDVRLAPGILFPAVQMRLDAL